MIRRYNFGDRSKKITFKKHNEKGFTNNCNHIIVICNGRTSLLPPSSSVVGTCRCVECGETFEAEIRHLDYVCRLCKGYRDFSDMFEYNKEYTEHEVIDTLVKNLNPDFIMHGRRLKYGLVEFADRNGDELRDFMNIIWAHNTKQDGPELVDGIFVEGVAFAISNDRLVMRECKSIKGNVKSLKYVVRDDEYKFHYIDLLHMMLNSNKIDKSIKDKVTKRLEYLKRN